MYVYMEIITHVYHGTNSLQLIESVYYYTVNFIEDFNARFVNCFYRLAMYFQKFGLSTQFFNISSDKLNIQHSLLVM